MAANPDWVRPAVLRLVDRESVTPLRLGLGIAAALVALYLAVEALAGRFAVVFSDPDPQTFQDFRITFVLIAAIAYVPAAQLAVVRAVRRAIGGLGGVLRLADADIERLRDAVGTCERRRYWSYRILWLAMAIAAIVVVDPLLEDGVGFDMPLEPIIHRILAPALIWLIVGLSLCVSADSRRLAGLAGGELDIELPDTRPLAPFAQAAGQMALVNVGLLSVILLFLGDLDASPGLAPALMIAGGATLTVAAVVLMRPLNAVRRFIQSLKAAELAECDGRLHALRRRWDGAAGDSATLGQPGMADVIAYRGMIEAVPEWPLSTPAAARIALYAGLPLGSWIAGAMVERAVDALLR